jgi:predicted flap endonuclease-1-like 5' DNA nuclease
MGSTTWIIVFAIVGLLLGLLIGWILWGKRAKACRERVRELQGTLKRQGSEIADLRAEGQGAEVRIGELEAALAEAQAATAVPEDLTVVEGIGPKIAGLLAQHGIINYGQLAASDVDRLREILREASLAMTDPTSWPEQAAHAAAGDWDALRALQEELKGGRRA